MIVCNRTTASTNVCKTTTILSSTFNYKCQYHLYYTTVLLTASQSEQCCLGLAAASLLQASQ